VRKFTSGFTVHRKPTELRGKAIAANGLSLKEGQPPFEQKEARDSRRGLPMQVLLCLHTIARVS
jgi:hypothetical protein